MITEVAVMILCQLAGIMTGTEKDQHSKIPHLKKIDGGPNKPSAGLCGLFCK
jgi:hypothetical protein